MSENPELLERIKKLLALSKSSNPSEAAIALSRAQKLMSMHHVTMDTVKLSSISEQRADIPPAMRDQALLWILAHIVCKAFGVKSCASYEDGEGNYHRNQVSMIFIGTPDRLATATYVYTILGRQAGIVKKQYAAKIRVEAENTADRVIGARVMRHLIRFGSYGVDFDYNGELPDYDRQRRNMVNAEVRKMTRAYMRGWLSSVYEKVNEFALSDEDLKLIENYTEEKLHVTTVRHRGLRFNKSQMEGFRNGLRDGKDGFDLYRGVEGAASPRLFFEE